MRFLQSKPILPAAKSSRHKRTRKIERLEQSVLSGKNQQLLWGPIPKLPTRMKLPKMAKKRKAARTIRKRFFETHFCLAFFNYNVFDESLHAGY
ncbi:hypothetical protein EBT16_12405 [bacterium]|nr:hypothetical protein [bacterium]